MPPGGDHLVKIHEEASPQQHVDLEEGGALTPFLKSERDYGGEALQHSYDGPSTSALSPPSPSSAASFLTPGGHAARPRVVIFTAAYYVCDGVSLTIRKLRAHLQAKGIESRVVSCGPEGWSEPDVFTVPCIPLPIVNAEDNLGYSLGLRLTEECKAQIRAFRPSVIHFTVPDFLAMDALRWARAEGIPAMGTWHSNYSDYLKFYHLGVIRPFVDRFIRSFYDHMPVYVPTPFIRKKLVENGFPEDRVGIWGRGVDLELFTPTHRSLAFRRARGIADDEVVILWVGRLVKEKSPDIWAEVVRRLHREDPGLRFRALVVGSGSYEGNMRGLPRTECLGWLGGKDLAEVYASVDVFLFPSEVETFGNVTLEALASGVPCVASAGCSGHLVYHGVNGFVVEGADAEAYYALTKRLVADAALRRRFADKARSSISTLEHDRVMDQMIRNYEGVVREGERERRAQGQRGQGGKGRDLYLTVVLSVFSFLMMVGTPLMKAYVAVVGALARLSSCRPFPLRAAPCSTEVLRSLVLFCSSSSSSRGGENATTGGNGSGAGVSFRERIRMVAVVVYLAAMVVIWASWGSLGEWTAAQLEVAGAKHS